MKPPIQTLKLLRHGLSRRFDGIGAVNGGGATSVLLKDYPEPQRSQILDMVYKPMFGASVSALLVEIPGDGNSTQGSMPSHMRSRDDLNCGRGYIWWILREAKSRNPDLTLDAVAWSAPGWIGDGEFWSHDMVEFYITWLRGLRERYGLELDAIGCRNEKGVSFEFAQWLRAALNKNGFNTVKLHAFDNWPTDKFDFVPLLARDNEARKAIDIIGAHVMYDKPDAHASSEVRRLAAEMGKPIWNTEDHVYKKGFDCQISIVECFNENYILSGATKIILWYDIGSVYPLQPYSSDPPMLIANEPWSGHFRIREALWGYAHYGQFTSVGWHYLDDGCTLLDAGGSVVTLQSGAGDISIIAETKDAVGSQNLRIEFTDEVQGKEFCLWRSNAEQQFVQLPSIRAENGVLSLSLDPNSIYSLSTTRGQRKGLFEQVPATSEFPFPYREDFGDYPDPAARGYLPRFFADIAGVFELAEKPDSHGVCLRQVIPAPTISWAPDWKPYTIIGDQNWDDLEVSVSVYLAAGETAAIMGRVCHVGTGYGFEPKGYMLELSAEGLCRLVALRGKVNKSALVGDAEQQALIKAQNDQSEGGELVLRQIGLSTVGPAKWHRLTLRFDGPAITGLVDGNIALSAIDDRFGSGMVGLLAGAGDRFSRPYFDDLVIGPIGSPSPAGYRSRNLRRLY